MINIDDVLQIVEESQSTFYKIEDLSRAKKAGNHIFSFIPTDDEGNAIDNGDNAATLEQLDIDLKRLGDGKYLLRHYRKENQKSRGHSELPFIKGVPAPRPGYQQPQRTAIGSLSGIEQVGGLDRVFEDRMERRFLEKEVAELRARNEELEAESADPSGFKTGIGMLTNAIQSTPGGEKLFQMAIGGIMGKLATIFSPGFAGVAVPQADVQNTPQTNNEIKVSIPENKTDEINQWLQANGQEITAVMAELYMVDSDIVTTLQKMAAKAKENPSLITMLKGFL